MLRIEPLGQLDGDRMGQGRSKHSSIDTAASREVSQRNGNANGTAFMPGASSSNGRLDASLRSGNGEGRNPLKRARGEMENEGDDLNSDYKFQFSRTPKQPRSSSRDRERQSLSPTSMRHSFVPERNDDQWKHSTRHQHQRTDSGGSNPAHRQGRADQWLPSRTFSSPPPRRSISPPTRLPLGPRGISSTGHAVMRNSLPTNDRRASESLERPRYTNLKWTNPSIQSGRVTNGPVSRPSASGSIVESPLSPVENEEHGDLEVLPRTKERSDVLKSAPTGPRLERNLIAANHAANRRPYIFISGASLPTTASTLEHLFKFLAKWVQTKFDISFDNVGWYLYFDNNEKGLRRLEECFWAKNRQKLFSQYVLEMSRHPGGLEDRVQESSGKIDDQSMAPVAAHLSRAADALKQLPTALRDIASSIPAHLPIQPPSTTLDPRLDHRAQAKSTPFSVETRANGYIPPLRHSSPLRVPLSVDRDDASSSISGLTGSDLSTSKLSKCHVCKKVSDRDILVHCSTCPRRWHRRCHKPDIPLDLGSDHFWQCRSCIRKNVQPKSRLSHASFTNDVSPVPSVGQPDEPPAKKRKLETPESRQASVGTPNDNSTGAPEQGEPDTNGILEQAVDSDQAYDPADVQEDDLDLQTTAHANTDELEDLVEKSFSTTKGAAKPQQRSKKPTMLNLTRKKVTRPVAVEASTAAVTESKDAEFAPEETSPKRERHKYTGRGADKAIIEAGMQKFFSDKRRGKDANGLVIQATMSNAQHSRLEVPESPEEPRTPSKSKSAPKEDEHINAEPQTSPKPKITLKNTKYSPRQDAHASRSQAAPSQRMKATGPSTGGRCQKCNKPIAFNPSGRKLCVSCKKTLTGSSATPPIEQPSKVDQRDGDNAPTTTPTAADQIQFHILDMLQSPASAQEEGSEASLVKDKITQLSPAKLDAACETCRIRHKRCTHRSAPVSLKVNDQNYVDEAVDEDDLDLWKTGPGVDESNRATDTAKRQGGDEPDEDERIGPDDDSDGSSPLSTAPDDAPPTATKIKKRESHARAATSEYDIGDSWSRPNNSYEKLIGMALCSAASQCLSAKEIINWIHTNVPDYDARPGMGNWVNGISATLSMRMEQDGKKGQWKKVGGDGPKKNARCSYQLLPGKEDEMLHWDPVLKQPVSPMKRRVQDDSPRSKKKRGESSSQNDTDFEEQLGDGLTSLKQTSKKRFKLSLVRTPKRPTKHAPKTVCDHPSLPFPDQTDMNDEDMEDELHKSETSEEEPLAASHKKLCAMTKARRDTQAATKNTDETTPVDELADSNGVSTLSESTAPKTPLKLPMPPESVAVDKKLVAQLIKEDAENVDYSAKSLYEEWPEWDPKNRFDREAKIAEIQARPTRKQKFGKQTQDPWAHWTRPSASARIGPPNFSLPKSNRIKNSYEDPVFEWQKNDDVKYYDTFEEMFGMPELPVAVLRDKEIAFRDGTREYDGSLRRANKIYPTGYAK